MAVRDPLACFKCKHRCDFCVCVCVLVGGTSVCLCVSNDGSFNVDE